MRRVILAAGALALVLMGAATAEAGSTTHRTHHASMHARSHHAHARPWYFGRSQDWAAAPRAYRRDRADFDGWVTDKGIR